VSWHDVLQMLGAALAALAGTWLYRRRRLAYRGLAILLGVVALVLVVAPILALERVRAVVARLIVWLVEDE
jgi:hypothetical protein